MGELRGPFKRLGYPIPEKVRIGVGFPSVRGIASKNQRIGECWSNERSGDDHHEIIISPVIADGMRVAGILTHELIHAAVGVEHGHKGPFRAMAHGLGLEGKMTATTEGEAFKRLAQPILDAIGPYPHAELHAMTNGWQKASRPADQMRVPAMRMARCGAVTAEAYVPLSFAPGAAYQFDWSHEVALINAVTVTVKLAHVRLCHSRMLFVRAYPRETQEMVFDAHNRCLRLL